MSAIRFYNRYTRQIEQESIYGEAYLRWTYEKPLGRLALSLLVKRSWFSRWYGWRMSRPVSRARVAPFIENYGLDTAEFKDAPDTYATFNDFFYRHLKSSARPIESSENGIAFPADGRHFAIPKLGAESRIYAKGQRFDVAALLGDPALAERFEGGACVVSRLCPVDYHRFHSPVAGKIVDQRAINGSLFSVSPVALRQRVSYLWENKRLLTVIESDKFGTVAFVAIGATCVGSIHMTKTAGESVAKGGELGYFAFGGSCVITLFEPGRAALAEDLAEHGPNGLEVYAKIGDKMGEAVAG